MLRTRKDRHFHHAVLWAVILSLATFILEAFYGYYANSLSIIFDASNFLTDCINYGISLYVLHKPQIWRTYAAMIKAGFMLFFGIYILISGFFRVEQNIIPLADIMVGIAIVSFTVNCIIGTLLFHCKNYGSDPKSLWLCSRNDIINNIATISAGLLVAKFNSKWPDLIAAAIMALLAVSAAISVFLEAKKELKKARS